MKPFLLVLIALYTACAASGQTPAKSTPAELKVVQIIDAHAALFTGKIVEREVHIVTLTEPVIVYLQTKGWYDGALLKSDIYPVGIRRYKTTLGQPKTVRTFTTSAEAAAKLIASGVDQQD